MNKRSAIALAGGVTGAIVSGVAGYTQSLDRPAAAVTPAKPIVRTEIRTITIHRKAKAPAVKAAGRTVVVHRPSGAPSHPAPPPAHHTGGSTHHGGDDDHGEHGGGDGGDD